MQPRAVKAGHGWAWIVQGYLLFRKSPAIWLALLILLFFTTRILLRVPLAGIVFVLFMPLFIAGLMEGCRALERGQPLELAHLFAGFRRNAAPLVTIGGVSLVGNLGIMMIMMTLGGDAITALSKTIGEGGQMTPELARETQAAVSVVTRALLVGSLISLPLLMAMWYAPLLVYFNDLGPVAAMKSSFLACLKNMGAMLVYGAIIFAGIFVAMPFAMALGQYDIALLLIAPVVLPSIYASYKDIFLAGTAPQPRTDSVAG